MVISDDRNEHRVDSRRGNSSLFLYDVGILAFGTLVEHYMCGGYRGAHADGSSLEADGVPHLHGGLAFIAYELM